MANLLVETEDMLYSHNKSWDDILQIRNKTHEIRKSDFIKYANCEYDAGYGYEKVDSDLMIIGKDWWFERETYDGSECWSFHEPIKVEKLPTMIDCGENFIIPDGIPVESGDITDVTKGIIVHQVNCQGVMGSGVAKAIRTKYPQHFQDYIHAEQRLGNIVVTKVHENLYVVGLFGQNKYGRNPDIVYTDYDAYPVALKKIKELQNKTGLPVYMPYYIGCGLANGDWYVISTLIDRSGISVAFVKKG